MAENTIEEITAKQNGDRAAVIVSILWIAGFARFNIAQIIVIMLWGEPAYDWRTQNLSVLGEATHELSILMNSAFIFQGAVLAVGVWAMRSIWRKSFFTITAQTMLTMAGLGYVAVGLAPDDTLRATHLLIGAAPILLFGAIGLIFAGFAMNHERFGLLWIATALLGIIALLSGFIFFIETDFGLGRGLIERIWAYAPLVWSLLIAIGTLKKEEGTKSDIPTLR